jgi:hypothetical protein
MGVPIDNGSIGIPNAAGDRVRGSDPTSGAPSPVRRGPGNAHVGSSAGTGRQASPVHPPDHRFDVGQAKAQAMTNQARQSAIEPGRGAIPIQPPGDGGAAAAIWRRGR